MCDGILTAIDLSLKAEQARPRLLLHACCAPCSSHTLEYLCKYFDITIYYYNPNIHPAEEYERRLSELENFLPRFLADKNAEADKNSLAGTAAARVVLQKTDYEPKEFFDAVQAERDNLQAEPERGERCRRCYQLRMERAYEYARQNNFDWFTTTLSISPHKDAQKINEIGRALEAQAQNAPQNKNDSQDQKVPQNQNGSQDQNAAPAAPKFLYSDFKKKNGYKRSLELSKEYGLYRQDYCGCIYSMKNRK